METLKEKKEIKCCPGCESPVISTFMIPGAEWFCMACKWSGGLFYAERQNHTEEKQKKYDELFAEYKKLREDYIPPTAYYNNCDECGSRNEHHILHASEEDKEKSKIAHSKLFGN